jgi:uncharacterized protein YjfI (DUF2170 family)
MQPLLYVVPMKIALNLNSYRDYQAVIIWVLWKCAILVKILCLCCASSSNNTANIYIYILAFRNTVPLKSINTVKA